MATQMEALNEVQLDAMKRKVFECVLDCKVKKMSTNETIDACYTLFPEKVKQGGEANDMLDDVIDEMLNRFGMHDNYN